ncbi:hypothetical protein AAC03nite_04870 [Alicyclobacillus acidoterrestris]|nr:hypothetical protein AAC03nite_04870 [Alicyclobacillus acidoterrestris]
MKHFLGKMIRPSLKDSLAERMFPPLPTNLDKRDAQQKALVGWAARRIGQLLTLADEDTDLLFYRAFTYQPPQKNESDLDNILGCAERLIQLGKGAEHAMTSHPDMRLNAQLEACLRTVQQEFCEEDSDSARRIAPSHIEQEHRASSQTVIDEWNPDVWQIYRDVMFAATQKKFLLIAEHEVNEYTEGRILLEMEIRERADITTCRQAAQQIFLDLQHDKSSVMGYLLAISEAVTNILKHAEYGTITLVENGESIHAIIKDTGPGFNLRDLPKTTLLAGYSTKKSLGQGFTLMMKMSAQVLLSTTATGSTIILVFNKKADGERTHA